MKLQHYKHSNILTNSTIGDLVRQLIYEYHFSKRLDMDNETTAINISIHCPKSQIEDRNKYYFLAFTSYKNELDTKFAEFFPKWVLEPYFIHFADDAAGGLISYVCDDGETPFYPSLAGIKEIRQRLIEEIKKYEEIIMEEIPLPVTVRSSKIQYPGVKLS